jgi:hypothetical protein
LQTSAFCHGTELVNKMWNNQQPSQIRGRLSQNALPWIPCYVLVFSLLLESVHTFLCRLMNEEYYRTHRIYTSLYREFLEWHTPVTFAVGLCVRNARVICRGKLLPPRASYVAHCKHVCAFLKVNTLFKGLTVDAQNVSLLLLNLLQVSWKDCFSSLTSIDEIVSRMLCLISSNVWGLFE